MSETVRILCVDDEPTVLALIVEVLRTEKWDVVTVEDGARALELLETQRFDLVVSDIVRPGTNGHELYWQVRAHEDPQHCAVPFLFVTGDPQTLEQASQLDLRTVLSKSDLVAQLVPAIERMLAP